MNIIFLLILILVNGFLALSEISLVLVKKSRLEHLVKKKKKNAEIALKLVKDPEHFLSAIQLGITLVGIISGAIGAYTLVDEFKQLFEKSSLLKPIAGELGLGIIVLTITYLSVVIGELVPKSLAIKNSERIALFVAPVIYYFSKTAYPAVIFLSSSTKFLVRLFYDKEKIETMISEDELIMLLKQAGKQGVLETWEPEFHKNLFLFADVNASELMTPREEIIWIEINQTAAQIKHKIQEIPHNNFLVGESKLDNLKGVFSLKRFFENYEKANFGLNHILEKPVLISEDMTAIQILERFRESKIYFGIVERENIIKGIITLHDLAEGIFGNLPDIGETV